MITIRPIKRPADQAASDPAPDRPETHGCCSDAAVEARTAEQFATLAILTRVGLTLVGTVERAVIAVRESPPAEPPEPIPAAEPPVATPEPAMPDEPPATAPVPSKSAERALADLAIAYYRIARAIQFNLTLETRITEEHRNRAACERAARAERCAIGETTRRNRLKDKVERVVKQAIDNEVPPIDRKDVRSKIHECLQEFDDDPDFTSRSVGEVAASVCGDLCLDPAWIWWEHEAWAVREIRTQPPGSPYVGWQPEPDDEPAPAPLKTAGHDPPRSGA
ncbi:MAG: hypothetical protein WCC64_10710 [Aliidongia sp.]